MTSGSKLRRKSPDRPKRRVGRPNQVSLDQILDQVMQMGFDNFSLHSLAAALNVTPSALYRHVANKKDLEERFVDMVTSQYPIKDYNGEDWKIWIREFALTLHEMYTLVPGLAAFTVRQTMPTGPVYIRNDNAVRAARDAGFGEAESFYATRAVIDFVAGWVTRAQLRDAVMREEGVHSDDHFATTLLAVADPKYEALKRAVRAARADPPNRKFLYTLDALIDGLYINRSGG